MNWDNTDSSGTWNFTTSTASTDTITLDAGSNTTTWDLPDPLIDWFPYKWKKYIPTWHLVKSYINPEIISLGLPKNESLEDFDKAMEQITQDSIEDWD